VPGKRVPKRSVPKGTARLGQLGLNPSRVTGLPPQPTEQKAAKTFEQKVAKVTKSLGSTFFFNVSN
jgi:hypothetical protein